METQWLINDFLELFISHCLIFYCINSFILLLSQKAIIFSWQKFKKNFANNKKVYCTNVVYKLWKGNSTIQFMNERTEMNQLVSKYFMTHFRADRALTLNYSVEPHACYCSTRNQKHLGIKKRTDEIFNPINRSINLIEWTFHKQPLKPHLEAGYVIENGLMKGDIT